MIGTLEYRIESLSIATVLLILFWLTSYAAINLMVSMPYPTQASHVLAFGTFTALATMLGLCAVLSVKE